MSLTRQTLSPARASRIDAGSSGGFSHAYRRPTPSGRREGKPTPATFSRPVAWLSHELAVRSHHQPGAAELVDGLAQDLAGTLIPHVVVEQPPVIRDLPPPIAPSSRTDERLHHALARKDSFFRKVHRPRFGASAVALAAPTPPVAGEGVEGAAAAIKENAAVPCAAHGERGRRLTVVRRRLPRASLGGGTVAGCRSDKREHREHEAPGDQAPETFEIMVTSKCHD